jgi:glycosyltransferase involved in cell wall biosynthesis
MYLIGVPVNVVRISTVVPTFYRDFKSLEQLSAALESVAHQTLLPDEIVVSDDSRAKDQSKILQVLEKYQHLNIKYVVNKQIKGVSGNSNNGIRNSSNEFIHVLHQDDQISQPKFYQDIVQILDCDINWVIADGYDGKNVIKPKIWRNQIPSRLLLGINTFGSPSSSVFRKLPSDHFTTSLVMFADIDFYFNLYEHYGLPHLLSGNFYIFYGTGEYQLQQSVTNLQSAREIRLVCEKYSRHVDAAVVDLFFVSGHHASKLLALQAISDFRTSFKVAHRIFQTYSTIRHSLARFK